jgi:uncharacterized repeat protein (TIGR01451 family)
VVIDTVSGNGDATSLTVGSGQTQICSGLTGTAGADVRGGSSYKAGASSVTMSWTTGASKDWDIAAVALRPGLPATADIATTVSGPSTVTAGAKVTYTITVTNSGSSTSVCVSVTDTLPAGSTFLSASGGGTASGSVVTWPTFNLAPNSSTTFTVAVGAPGNGTMSNTVSSTSLTYDPDASNNNGTASGASVITSVTGEGNAGSDGSSCVTATNVATKTWSHTVNSGNNRILIVGIALADHATSVSSITYGGTALTRITQSIVRNEVEIWYVIAPPVGTANVVANWSAAKDMVGWSGTFTNVDQTYPIGDSQIANGNNTTPSVTVSAASGDIVVDTVSANGDGLSLTVGAGQTQICSGATGTAGGDCRGASSYESGASSVTMSWTEGAAKDWDIAAVVLKLARPVQADIVTTKTGASTVYATSNITYTVTVTNCGPATGSNIVVSDTLPAGSTFVSASSGGTNASGVVTWTISSLAYAGLTNLTVTVTAPSSGSLTNTVSSTSSTSDPDASNNNGTSSSAKVTTTVLQTADVKTTKTGATTVYATSNLTYTITVTNQGPNTATNIIVSDTLPSNATFVSASSGGTNGSGVVTWPTMTNCAIGFTTNFTVTVTAPTTGSLTNTVSSTATSTDLTPSNNDGSSSAAKVITTVTPVADVKTTKTGAASVYATSNLTYTITVTNQGPNTSSNIVVSDTLPSNATFVSASSGGTNGSGVVTWPTMTNCAVGFITNFTVTVTAPTSGSLTNTVSSTATTTDQDSSNNDGSSSNAKVITTVTPVADVKTTKTGATTVYATSNLTYTITVTNQGPNTSSNIVVSDTLPSNATFVSASSGGTNGSGVVTWPTMTNCAVGFTTNLTVTVTAPSSGSMTNTVSSTATTTDQDSSNNDGSSSNAKVITTVSHFADIAVTKSGVTTVTAGSNLVYTIALTNRGPNAATNVVVTDTLPATGTFVSASSGGTNGSGVITWPTLTNCASGFTTNFTVTLTAPASGSLTNSAAGTTTSTDLDSSNNDGSSSAAKVITSITPSADVRTTKTGATNVVAGANLIYTITVTNLGPSTANNVVVNDTLPTGATFVSADSGGSYSAGVVTWPTITNCLIGFITNYTVTITAPSGGPLTNISWSTSTTGDPDASNNDGSSSNAKVITSVTPSADVETIKTGPTSAQGTSNITYTITITNLGPSTASNVVVSDTLPSTVTFVSASSGGTQSGGVVTWPALTNFPYAASTNFTVTVTLPADGSVTNVVSSTSDTSDPNAANNNGTASGAKVITSIVAALADIATTVTGPVTVLGGSNLTYTLTVTNIGPGGASNVVVIDTLPAGVTFVSASSGGSYSAGVVTWPTMTNFANAATTNFTVTVTAPESGTLTNIVSSTSITSDPISSNNDGSSSDGQVITLVLGVNVTGYVYLDANKNGFKDGSEAGTGLSLYAKIYATTNASGPALQAAAVDGSSGAYTLTNIYRGTYMLIIDNNNLLSDVTPTLRSGWTGTEMPAQTRTNVTVVRVAVPNQNFGLIHSIGLSGRVFKDTGVGGGTANDGIVNGAEAGLAGVTVKLTDNTGTTIYDTVVTDGSGNYTLLIPNSVANGATLKVTETNAPVYRSTGASIGDTSGSYDRASDTVTFTYTVGASYSGVNFGDVPENSFVNDSQQAALPGSFVLHPHTFTAGSGGSVSFSVASLPSPNIPGWSQVLYRDVNCNGQIDSGDTVISAAITVAAGDKICLLVKDFVPATAPYNAQDQLTVTAAFTWTAASPALSTNTTRTDLTTAGNPTTAGLTLLKAVDKETALPGQVLSYTVTYANKSSAALTNIVIFDNTPAFTTFTSAAHGALPNNITGIAVSSPSVGAAGAIKWTFTGSLAPSKSGTVTFSVTVSQ